MPEHNQIIDIRSQFPALKQKIHGRDLVYLDSAATALKPVSVIERLSHFLSLEAANVHRGAHSLSDGATNEFEHARENVRKFVNASSIEEIVFTRGTTESINLVASSIESLLTAGQEIVLTEMEHHSNIVPWQVLAQKKNLTLKYITVTSAGEIDLESLESTISEKTALVAFTGCSNILGTLTPIEAVIKKAKSVGALTLVDAAQLVSQQRIDVQKLDVDFLVFSAHKLFGPFGIGVLYGKKKCLNQLSPYQYGGSMISTVKFSQSEYNHLPFKFEAGTPNISGAIGMSKAIDFFSQYQINELFEHEQLLLNTSLTGLSEIAGFKPFGSSAKKAAILSFTIDGLHHSDIGQILDQQGVAVRVGHHCTQPLLQKFGLTGTVRASFSIYNNLNDVDQFVEAVKKAKRMLS